MRTLLIDNYDSYSHNLVPLIAAAFGTAPLVRANDAVDECDLSGFDAVVISPGPGTPARDADRGVLLDRILGAGIPTLGVCFGHQALGWMCGAEVVPAPQPRHGYRERIRHTGTELFRGIPQDFAAVRYHSLCLAELLPAELEATAWAGDGVVMGVRHRERPWWGVQFHPESVATEHGLALMMNFAALVRAHRGDADPRTSVLLRRRLDVEIPTELLFDELFADHAVAFWLDSSLHGHGGGRYSFLGDSGGPLGEVLQARAGAGHVDVRRGDDARETDESCAGSIFEVLEQRLEEERLPADPEIPFALAGGYVGYFGYELRAELGSPIRRGSAHPDALWMRATRMVAVDHETGETWVLALADGTDECAAEGQRWIDRTATTILSLRGRPVPDLTDSGEVADIGALLERPRDRYLADVDECLSELRAGESYEICLTNAVDMPFPGRPLDAYRRLRRGSPAPYAAYLRFGDLHILSSSSERYLTIDPQGAVESRPIKGTCRRAADPVEDAALRAELLSSPKTRAENLMIVDLLRNDLGRVCEIGSVHVPALMQAESYATVHQLVSTVRGRLRPGLGPLDAVRASFPGGSMTGAPKLRTMQIIDRLEGRARGVYSGALGFFGLHGGADLSIVIRTAVVSEGRARIGVGGAIVLDSDPEEEYAEMLLKASAVVRALAASR